MVASAKVGFGAKCLMMLLEVGKRGFIGGGRKIIR